MNTESNARTATLIPFEPALSNGTAVADLMELVEEPAEISPSRDFHAPTSGRQPIQPDVDFLRHYGLRENPFSDSVNPAFFYKTEGHAEALNRMLLAVNNNVSLGMITGLSGTGKTLVTQLLLQHLDPATHQPILVLVIPGLSKTGLLREILSELSVAVPEGINRTQDLLKLLSNCIIELHEQGRRLVMIIDECHLLSAECLHILRTISNIEIPERKLTTCLLFGEQRFANRLAHPSYEALRNRMYLRGELRPMNAEECTQYIKFRLMTAGRISDLFDPAAFEAAHTHSGGVCRNLNKLCMLTLLQGALQGKSVIDADVVASGAGMM